MSYVMQGAQRMGRRISFGTLEKPSDLTKYNAWGWWRLRDENDVVRYEGPYATLSPRPDDSFPDGTAQEWLIEQCKAGRTPYVSRVAESAPEHSTIALYAGPPPLPKGFEFFKDTPFDPFPCGSCDPSVDPNACMLPEAPPPEPTPRSDKTLIFGAMALVAAAGGFYLYKRRPR